MKVNILIESDFSHPNQTLLTEPLNHDSPTYEVGKDGEGIKDAIIDALKKSQYNLQPGDKILIRQEKTK